MRGVMIMKKKLCTVVTALVMVLSLVVAAQMPIEAQAASKVKLNKKTVAIKTGGTTKLSVRSKSVDEVEWLSNNSDVATVSSRGKVTGISVGTTYVRAKCTLYSGKTKNLKCKVIVKSGRYLKNPKPYQQDGVAYTTVTMMGTTYTNAMTDRGVDHTSVAYYNLNGDYQTLSFTIGHVDGENNRDGSIEIILDDEIVASYTSEGGDMGTTVSPKQCTVDVSNGVILQIKMKGCGGTWSWSYAIADILLDKGHD